MFNMRAIRLMRGLTLKEVGEKIGITESAVAHYETGRRKPDYEMLLKISEVLDCTVCDLLYPLEDKKTPDTIRAGLTDYERAVLSADEETQNIILRFLRLPSEQRGEFLSRIESLQTDQ